jgi:hypothetical protein
MAMRRAIRHCNRLTPPASFFSARPVIPAFIASSIVKPRAQMGPAETVRQMAEDMRAAEYRDGGITADDLKTLGFTAGQIKTHGDDARLRAQSLSRASV